MFQTCILSEGFWIFLLEDNNHNDDAAWKFVIHQTELMQKIRICCSFRCFGSCISLYDNEIPNSTYSYHSPRQDYQIIITVIYVILNHLKNFTKLCDFNFCLVVFYIRVQHCFTNHSLPSGFQLIDYLIRKNVSTPWGL